MRLSRLAVLVCDGSSRHGEQSTSGKYHRSHSSGDEVGFPLPSTGRGIEGEGWNRLSPQHLRKRLYIPTPHPSSRLRTRGGGLEGEIVAEADELGVTEQ